MSDLRETAIDAIRQLPQDVDWDDIMEQLYFKSKIDRAREEARQGNSISNEEMKKELGIA